MLHVTVAVHEPKIVVCLQFTVRYLHVSATFEKRLSRAFVFPCFPFFRFDLNGVLSAPNPHFFCRAFPAVRACWAVIAGWIFSGKETPPPTIKSPPPPLVFGGLVLIVNKRKKKHNASEQFLSWVGGGPSALFSETVYRHHVNGRGTIELDHSPGCILVWSTLGSASWLL